MTEKKNGEAKLTFDGSAGVRVGCVWVCVWVSGWHCRAGGYLGYACVCAWGGGVGECMPVAGVGNAATTK